MVTILSLISFSQTLIISLFSHQMQMDHHQRWAAMKQTDDPCSSIEEASTISNLSSSSSPSCSSFDDTTDDASSANSSRSSLYDLSDLMSHLPIKRGLSKFYHGKSDSFTSFARITSIEDIPKKEKKSHKKIKKSYRFHTLPKPTISKKNSRKKKFGNSIKKEING